MVLKMAIKEFFPQRPESHPMIYAYSDNNPQYKELLKVGYTEEDIYRGDDGINAVALWSSN